MMINSEHSSFRSTCEKQRGISTCQKEVLEECPPAFRSENSIVSGAIGTATTSG